MYMTSRCCLQLSCCWGFTDHSAEDFNVTLTMGAGISEKSQQPCMLEEKLAVTFTTQTYITKNIQELGRAYVGQVVRKRTVL